MAKINLKQVLTAKSAKDLFTLHLQHLGFQKFEIPLFDEETREQETKKSKAAWKDLTSIADDIIVVMPNGIGHKRIKSFKEFDTYIRTNDIEGEEVWYLESESSLLLKKLTKAVKKECQKKFS